MGTSLIVRGLEAWHRSCADVRERNGRKSASEDLIAYSPRPLSARYQSQPFASAIRAAAMRFADPVFAIALDK
ncbi:hypothetical protein GCM10010922_10960 [Microbacterium sorbitolivorans]|nr:hypothetical protein GCM10010922_10960 [Microbacterium sorbitolivorans]